MRFLAQAVVLLVTLMLGALALFAQDQPIQPIVPASMESADSVSVVVPLHGVKKVVMGGYAHGCALMLDGTVRCWGANDRGQIGDGSTTHRLIATRVVSLTNVVDIAAWTVGNCALLSDGTVRCWGGNTNGSLGIGSTGVYSATPVVVPGLDEVTSLGMGQQSHCAVRSGGEVWCWGSNSDGQVNPDLPGGDYGSPVPVTGVSNAVKVVTGGHHSCALLANRNVSCWGSNVSGYLGDGGGAGTAPRLVKDGTGTLSGVFDIRAGIRHTCAHIGSGTAFCWGSNYFGTIGDGTYLTRTMATQVVGLNGPVIGIGGGSSFSCVIVRPGEGHCWGWNAGGVLGTGDETDSPLPVAVEGLSNEPTQIVGGGKATCALLKDTTVECWGVNISGNLGDGTTDPRLFPAPVITTETCYKLSVDFDGPGALPSVTPSQSQGCPAGHFFAGTNVHFGAAPNTHSRVHSWANTTSGSAGENDAFLVVPPSDATVGVTYEPCRLLTLAHVGEGSDPAILSPASSIGCASGRFAAGAAVSVSASPAAGWKISGWEGTINNASTSVTNEITMPNTDATVRVLYEQPAPAVPADEIIHLPMITR